MSEVEHLVCADTVECGLLLMKSQIPEAELGLWAARDFKQYETIGYYLGELSNEELDDLRDPELYESEYVHIKVSD